MNLTGVANAILANIKQVAGINDPQYKITPVGALKAVLENNAVSEITNLAGLQKGLDRTIKVRAIARGVEGDVSDTDSCDVTISPAFYEHEITATNYHQIGIYIDDATMRTFEEQAAAGFQVNGVPVPSILYEMILTKVNGLIQKIDRTILTAIETGKGKNAVTGSTTKVTVNFASSLTDDDGYVKLLTDAEANEVAGDLMIIGSGIVRNFDILNKLKTAADSNGFGGVNYNVYNDPKAASVWGANEFFTIQKGAVGLADWLKNGGSYSGERGGAMYFTVPVPVQLSNGELSALVFDAQLEYRTCPIYDDEGVKLTDRGWILILSKSFGVYTAPLTSYQSTDPLYQVNGIFHYQAAKEEVTYAVKNATDTVLTTEIQNEVGDPITVNQDPVKVDVTGITTSDSAETVAIGATWNFASKLTIAPANASIKWVLYSTSAAGVATISQAGVVTGVAQGTAIVTATTVDGLYTATATITVPSGE